MKPGAEISKPVHSKLFSSHSSCCFLSWSPALCLLQNNAAKNCSWWNDNHLVSRNVFFFFFKYREKGKAQSLVAQCSVSFEGGREALAVKGSSSPGGWLRMGFDRPEVCVSRMESMAVPSSCWSKRSLSFFRSLFFTRTTTISHLCLPSRS